MTENTQYLFRVTPVSKPRMTRSDRWAKRPAVVSYFAFKDELVRQAEQMGFVADTTPLEITFYLPIPRTWSLRKKELKNSTPHDQKPDLDNLLKAVFDALWLDDKSIWSVKTAKYWSSEPKIIIKYED